MCSLDSALAGELQVLNGFFTFGIVCSVLRGTILKSVGSASCGERPVVNIWKGQGHLKKKKKRPIFYLISAARLAAAAPCFCNN